VRQRANQRGSMSSRGPDDGLGTSHS
jgi:hypothetical protein